MRLTFRRERMADAKSDKGLCRSVRIELNKAERAKIDREARTIELAFSSEEPVERWGENEVLSHEAGEYDFTRLNASHPLLLGHNEYDPTCQIGVVESARVDGDKIGRAIVRFSKSKLGEEIWQDVQDGIRQLVSVGYDRTSIVSSKKAANNMTTVRYRWSPTHIAIVPVPADTKVGIGRTLETTAPVDSPAPMTADAVLLALPEEQKQLLRTKLMSEKNTNVEVLDEQQIRTAERASAAKAFQERAKQITAIAEEFIKDHGKKNGGKLADSMRQLAGEALVSDMSLDQFKSRCLTEVVKAKPAAPVMIEDLTDAEGQRNYSLLRGIQSCIERKSTVPDGLEGEVHQEILNRAKRDGGLGYDAEGFQVPSNAPMRCGGMSRAERGRRDMQATVFGAGGAFVPTNLVVPIIELLRNRMILESLGVRTMAGLQGNIVIPRAEAAATAYSVSEIGLLTASQQVLGQIALTPKRVGATQTYSKQFVMQSTPDAEAFMRDDLFKVIALLWDRLGLNGQGAASEPLGIINTPGVGSVLFGATPTYTKMVAFETAIRTANVTDPIAYVTTPTVKGTLKITPATLTGSTVVSGVSNALWVGAGDGGEINGYPAFNTNQVPNNLVIAGAFNQLIHALWGGLDVVVDQYTKAANAEIVITINTWGDYAVRHPQAFVVSADAGNQ